MNEEDTLIQQELVEEIMKASEQFPNVILYMETVMESYEELEQENNQLKEVIEEIRKIVKVEKEKMGYAVYDSCLLFIEEALDKVDKER